MAERQVWKRRKRRWVGDTTELVIGGSATLYLAVILGMFSRFIVGWAVSPSNDRHLTLRALEKAIKLRSREVGLLHHSDRGGPYTCEDYQLVLAKESVTVGMGRSGNCIDNAAMENWNSSLKSELGEHFETFGAAKDQFFDYIEVFYNKQRLHSSLDYVPPAVRSERKIRGVANSVVQLSTKSGQLQGINELRRRTRDAEEVTNDGSGTNPMS